MGRSLGRRIAKRKTARLTPRVVVVAVSLKTGEGRFEAKLVLKNVGSESSDVYIHPKDTSSHHAVFQDRDKSNLASIQYVHKQDNPAPTTLSLAPGDEIIVWLRFLISGEWIRTSILQYRADLDEIYWVRFSCGSQDGPVRSDRIRFIPRVLLSSNDQ